MLRFRFLLLQAANNSKYLCLRNATPHPATRTRPPIYDHLEIDKEKNLLYIYIYRKLFGIEN